MRARPCVVTVNNDKFILLRCWVFTRELPAKTNERVDTLSDVAHISGCTISGWLSDRLDQSLFEHDLVQNRRVAVKWSLVKQNIQ